LKSELGIKKIFSTNPMDINIVARSNKLNLRKKDEIKKETNIIGVEPEAEIKDNSHLFNWISGERMVIARTLDFWRLKFRRISK